jgi:hypothetical protein
MAKKRKPKKRPYTPPAAPKAQAAVADAAPAAPARRMHKEEARQARERALKLYRRRNRARRVITFVAVLAVVYGVFFLLTRVGTPELPDAALASAKGAGCSGLVPQPDRGGGHAPPYEYPDKPATSGSHDPSPFDAGVYGDPIPEERAVHSLEHAYVIMYYRAEGPRALSDEALSALEALAETDGGEPEEKVILAPYAELPAGTTLAFAAWNNLLTCPAAVEPDVATTIGQAFIDEFRGANFAPEPAAP